MPTRRPTMMRRTRKDRIAEYVTDSGYEIDEHIAQVKLGGKNEFILYGAVKRNYEDEGVIYIGGETRPGADIYENRDRRTALGFVDGFVAGFRAASSK